MVRLHHAFEDTITEVLFSVLDCNHNFEFYFSFSILMQAKEPWQSTPEEKLAIARHHKTKGTDCYKVKPLCTLIGLPAYLLFEPRC